LRQSIAKTFTLGLQVPSLFKSKQVDLLKQMEYITHPVDLMTNAHSILFLLAQYFGIEEGFLTFDDTLIMLFGLTSIGLTANSVSIVKFFREMERCATFRYEQRCKKLLNYYCRSITIRRRNGVSLN
jgi:hypothetical protein